MGISPLFRGAGKLRLWPALNGFKQVLIAYLAKISYLDKLVQPSYTLSTQIRLKATPRACKATLDTLTSVVMLIMQQLSRLIDGDLILQLRQEG